MSKWAKNFHTEEVMWLFDEADARNQVGVWDVSSVSTFIIGGAEDCNEEDVLELPVILDIVVLDMEVDTWVLVVAATLAVLNKLAVEGALFSAPGVISSVFISVNKKKGCRTKTETKDSR